MAFELKGPHHLRWEAAAAGADARSSWVKAQGAIPSYLLDRHVLGHCGRFDDSAYLDKSRRKMGVEQINIRNGPAHALSPATMLDLSALRPIP